MDENTGITREELEQGIAGLLQVISSSASWFYWIAALSLVNVISSASGGDWGFAIGLNFAFMGTGIGVFFVILFGVFGLLAHKRHQWAFITGFVLYILDSLLAVLAIFAAGFDFWVLVNIGFHVYALYGIFQGIRANGILKKLEREAAAAERQQAFTVIGQPMVPPPPYQPAEAPAEVPAAASSEAPSPEVRDNN